MSVPVAMTDSYMVAVQVIELRKFCSNVYVYDNIGKNFWFIICYIFIGVNFSVDTYTHQPRVISL